MLVLHQPQAVKLAVKLLGGRHSSSRPDASRAQLCFQCLLPVVVKHRKIRLTSPAWQVLSRQGLAAAHLNSSTLLGHNPGQVTVVGCHIIVLACQLDQLIKQCIRSVEGRPRTECLVTVGGERSGVTSLTMSCAQGDRHLQNFSASTQQLAP